MKSTPTMNTPLDTSFTNPIFPQRSAGVDRFRLMMKGWGVKILSLMVVVMGVGVSWGQTQVATRTTAGDGTVVVPSGVSKLSVELTGAGGGGGETGSVKYSRGSGGAGGTYIKHLLAVSSGTYNYTVGAGGASATVGSNSFFGNTTAGAQSGSTVIANGGAAGITSTVAGSATTFNTAVANTAVTTNSLPSSGSVVLNAGTSGSAGTGSSTSSISGAGGAGAGYASSSAGGGAAVGIGYSQPGNPGTAIGGGGSGGCNGNSSTNRTGGAGGVGKAVITYYNVPTVSSLSVSSGPSGTSVTVTGTNFYSGLSKITVDGTEVSTTYLTSTTVSASITGSAGAHSIGINNSDVTATGFGISSSTSTLTFTIATFTNYYSKSTGNLETLSNWGTATDGTGTAPTDFTSANQVFNIRNNATPTIGAAWTVSGTNSKIIVGDGTNGCNFTIPALYSVTGTVDVAAAATLTLQHLTSFPTFGTLDATGTIVFDGNGTQTIPTGTYGNLTIQNAGGVKTAGGNITIAAASTLTVTSTLDMSTFQVLAGGATANVAINGTFRTANTLGFSGATTTAISSTNTSITIGASSTIVYNAASPQAVTSRTYANLQISNSGAAKTPGGNITLGNSNTFTLDAGVTYTAGTTTMTFGTSGTATINGIFKTGITAAGGFSGATTSSIVSTNTPTITLGSGSTVEYNSTSGQTISTANSSGTNGTLTYYNLLVSGITTTKTFNASPAIAAGGTFTINSNCTANFGTTSMSFGAGSFVVINGTLQTQAATGFSGGGSTSISNTNAPTITLGSNSTIEYSRTTVQGATQTITARDYRNLIISGTSTMSLGGNVTIQGGSTMTVSSNLACGNNTISQSGSGTATISVTGTISTTNIDGLSGSATTTITSSNTSLTLGSASTVDYASTSTSNQTITAGTYFNITNTGSTATSIGRTLIGTINISGAFTTGSGYYTIGTSTVEFNGSTAQTIPVVPVASGGNYYNLNYSGSSTGTLGGSISLANNLSVTGGTLRVNSATSYSLTVNGSLTLTAAIIDLNNTGANVGILNAKGDINISGANSYITTGGSVNGKFQFTGTTQTYANTATGTNVGYVNYEIGEGTNSTTVTIGNTLNLINNATYPGTLTIFNNATLNAGTNNISSSGTTAAGSIFVINSGGTLATANTGGILGTGTSSSNGTINTTNVPSRTFTAGANYTFNGITTTAFPTTLNQASLGNPANITTTVNISLNRPVTMSGTLTLGGILTTTATNTLTLTNTANTAISGGSSTSFINGPVTWTMGATSTGTYTVPVGVTSAYYPMAFAAGTIASGSPTINVQAFATGVSSADGTTLSATSGNEYWTITTTGATFAASAFSLGRSSPALGTLDAIGKSTSNGTLSYSKIGGTVGTLSGQPGINTSSSGLSGAGTLYLSLAKIAGPVITGTATATAFTTTYGTPSTAQTFTINGYNLTADLVATAPTGFEVSTDGVTYGSTATFTQSSGSVSGSLRVRYTATAAVGGTYNGQTISLASTNATTKYITTASTGNSITAKALTMSGLSVPASKVYDGSTAAVVTDAKTLQAGEAFGTGTSSDGKPYTGDVVDITGTPVGTYNYINVASATTVTYSGLSLTGAAAGNYSLTIQGTSAATITTKALTMTGLSVPASKTYDGGTTAVVSGTAVLQNAQAVGAGNTSDGKPYTGDVVSITGTVAGTYNTKDVSTATTVTYSGLSLTGAQGTNYSLTQGTTSATITTKSLTISGLTANNKNYDGTTTATLSGTPSLVGVISADIANVTLGGTYSANFVTSSVGIGIAVTVTGYTISGSANTNYSLTQPSGLTADITSATITGAATATAFTTTYGTASSPQSFAVSGSGLSTDITATAPTGFQVSSDGSSYGTTAIITNSGGNASGTVYIKLAANAPATGSYNSNNIVLSSTGASNVNIATAASGNTVSPKALTMSGLSVPASKEYNRNTTAVVTDSKTLLADEPFGTGNSSDGKPYTGDVVSITGTPVGTYNTKDVATATTVSYSGLSLTGAAAGNYSLTIQSTSAATITAKGLTVTGASVTSKIYTGTNTATITGATLSGVISPDAVTPVAGSNTFNSVNVANGISVTTNYSLSGADASNYSITQPTLTGNITTATLTIINVSGVSRAYDGGTAATVTGTPAYSGLQNGETFTVTGSPTFSFADASAANGKSITIGNSGYTAPSANYTVTQPTLTANITKVPLTITAADQSVAYATSVATVTGAGTYTPTGFVNSETASVIGGSATYSTTYTITTAAGATGVTITPIVSGLTATNYSFTAATGTITVIKANQIITFAATASATTTTADYAPGATSASSATNPITYASNNAAVATIVSGQIHIVGVGTATITASQAASANYNAAADVTQTLTVTVNTDVFRSKATGNWNTAGTWESAATTAGPFATATTTPGANNPVYIQSGHTVTLTQNESVNDLHIASGTAALGTRGIVALATYTLSVNGMLRNYIGSVGGALPGSSQTTGYSAYPFTASTGKVSIVGNTRNLTNTGEWAAIISTPSTGVLPLEINLNSGQIASLGTSIKITSLNVVSGTLDAVTFTVGLDNGTTGQGDVNIASGALITSAAATVFQRTGTSRGGTLTLDGSLVLSNGSPAIAMNSIVFNGTVEYSASGIQTLAVLASSGTSPNTYTNLKLSGTSAKSLGVNTTVNGTLTIAGTASLALNSKTLTYGGSSTLEYAGSAAQTTSTAAELSAIPPTVKINNTSGVSVGQSVALTALDLTDGIVTTNANVLTIAATGSVSNASTTSYVYGNLKKFIAASSTTKTFEIGDATVYAPVTLGFTGTITNSTGTIQASTTSGDHAQISTSGLKTAKTVNRTWTLSNTVALTGLTSYNPTFNFVSGDLDGTATTSNFVVKRYASSSWNTETIGTKNSTNTQATGVTGFGDFQIGEAKATPTLSIDNNPQTYTGSAIAANVTGSVAGTVSNVKYGGSTTAPTNAGTYAVTANLVPTDGTNYNSLTDVSAGNFIIDKATPTLSVTNTPITYDGLTHSATATASGSGTVSNIITGGAATQTNAGTYTVTADIAASSNYNAATGVTASNSFVISKATPSITTAPTATNIILGQALSTSTLSGGSASPAGTFAFTSPSTVPGSIGNYSASVTYTPIDVTNYNTATTSVNVQVVQSIATISNSGITQITTQNITRGNNNVSVYTFKAVVTIAANTLSSVSFTTPNNSITNNYVGGTDINNFKLWYGTTTDFASATQLGVQQTSLNNNPSGGETITFGTGNGIPTSLAVNTYYFWVTADVLNTATSGKKLTINAPTLTLASGSTTGTIAATGIQTIIAGAATNYYLVGTNLADETNWNTDANATPATITGRIYTIINPNDANLNIDNESVSNSSSLSLGTNSKIIVKNTGQLTLTAGTINGTIDVENGGTLNINTTSIPTLGTLGTTSSTVIYSANGNQAVTTKPYAHLTISGSGIKTVGAATVAGTLSLNGGTLDIGSSTFVINGPVTQTSGTIDADAGTLSFGNSANMSLLSSLFSGDIYNLSKSSGSGVLTVNDNLNITNNVSTSASTGALVLASTKQLTVDGIISNNGTLTIESGATLKQTGTGNNSGNGTYNVKQTITGSGGSTPNGRFWYLGSPLSNGLSTALLSSTGNQLWQWNEGAGGITIGYATVSSGQTLTQGKSYVLRSGQTSETINFSGTGLSNGTVTVPNLTRTGTTQQFRGCHLVSNPYPSYLDWDLVDKTYVSTTMYVRTASNSSIDVLETYNSYNGQGTSISGPAMTQYIAPMQGFWVKVPTDGQTGSLTMTNAMRSHQPTGSGLRSTAQDFPAFLRFNMLDGQNKDQVILLMSPDASMSLDNFDSEKMSASGYAQFYSTVNATKLVINGMKNVKAKTSVPLTLVMPTSKSYTFQAEEFNIEDGLILLEDKQEGVIQDLTINPTYSFFGNAGTNATRFVVHFQLATAPVLVGGPQELENLGSDELTTDNIQIVSNNQGTVIIRLDEGFKPEGSIRIFDASGRLVEQTDFNDQETTIHLNEQAGMYFVEVSAGKLMVKKKIIIN